MSSAVQKLDTRTGIPVKAKMPIGLEHQPHNEEEDTVVKYQSVSLIKTDELTNAMMRLVNVRKEMSFSKIKQ